MSWRRRLKRDKVTCMKGLFPRLDAADDALALSVGDLKLSYRELAARIVGHGQQLAAQGLLPGARIGVWTQPSLDTLVAMVANAALGFVSVPLDPKLGPLELGHLLKDSAPVVTLAADPAQVQGRSVVPVWGPARATSGRLETPGLSDDPALILYTSGTTGLPKGAVISTKNIASNLDALASAWKWADTDTVVHALPMFHVHGLVLGLFGALRSGGALHWVPRFEPLSLVQALRSGAAGSTMLFAVPTMYHRLAEAAASEPAVVAALASTRVLVSGSAALPQREHVRLEALTGRRIIERYGLTETLINCAVRLDDGPSAGWVGRPLEGVELRLVDDAGQVLPRADEQALGEVQVRGPNVFVEYLNRPEATAAARAADGWFSTGDIACQRGDGAVRIVGRRSSDLIKVGGYKVGAGEVEAALLEHEAVREAAVIGVPDDDLGERIIAFVVPGEGLKVTPGQLEHFVAAQLSPHKRPREVRLVASLPRNAMGKLLKTELKKGY